MIWEEKTVIYIMIHKKIGKLYEITIKAHIQISIMHQKIAVIYSKEEVGHKRYTLTIIAFVSHKTSLLYIRRHLWNKTI
jgi:hypothetical protein